MKFQINLIFALIASFLISCERPECMNSNPVFAKYKPESKEYKTELLNQLKKIDNSKLSFWFKEFKNDDETLIFNVQADGLCALIQFKVKQWDKLSELRTKKGISFGGAEFKNIKFYTLQDSNNIEFILTDFDRIID